MLMTGRFEDTSRFSSVGLSEEFGGRLGFDHIRELRIWLALFLFKIALIGEFNLIYGSFPKEKFFFLNKF